METTVKKSTTKHWISFLLSLVAFFGVYAVGGGYCSMVLPWTVTSFAMALDLL
jgi:nitrate reductase NapE component